MSMEELDLNNQIRKHKASIRLADKLCDAGFDRVVITFREKGECFIYANKDGRELNVRHHCFTVQDNPQGICYDLVEAMKER